MSNAPDQHELRDEIRWLGEVLGEVIREQEGDATFELVEEVRALSRDRREGGVEAEDRILERLSTLELEEVEPLIGALSVFFDLANLAEDRQRVRVVRSRARAGDTGGTESVEEAVRTLEASGLDIEDIRDLLLATGIEFVFTAHPTEAKRRSVREKVRDLRRHLYALDSQDLLPGERVALKRLVKADLTGLWQTDFVRFRRPTVLEELDRSLFFAGNLWEVVPALFRELESALTKTYPQAPGDPALGIAPPIRFGTWIGGDRDGNPFVTAEVTERALGRLRHESLHRHVEQARRARGSLSLSARKAGVSRELLTAMSAALQRYPALADETAHLSLAEPYRRWLRIVQWRLEQARRAEPRDPRPEGAYADPEEFVSDLRLARRSLVEHGGALLADAHLDDWIRQAEVFGFSLMRLDIRQESSWYHTVMDELMRRLGIHDTYGSLDEEARQEVLAESMPLDAQIEMEGLSEETRETLSLFRLMASVCRMTGPGAFGAQIISMTHQPSDILVVLWLSRWAAVLEGLPDGRLPIPIAPLFETIEDLSGAAATLDLLLSHPGYREHLRETGGKQIVMIGYSDSTKDGGYMAASWHLFEAQFEMDRAARRRDTELVFFHGRGGALGRGGGPAARHIRSLPARTLRSGLRITEQGEVLAERYDDPRIARRHLQQMLSAVLVRGGHAELEDAARDAPDLPSELLHLLAERSEAAYRELVDHPGFLRYFEEATPIQGIEDLPIGSRPARRSGRRSLETLRAIPWVFSWTQSRHMIPAWYGLGTALDAARELPQAIRTLRALYRTSGFFGATIDNAALALAKADMGIARVHASLVEDPEVREDVWGLISAEFDRTRAGVLEVTDQTELLDEVPWLKRSIQVRNPYVDPLNFLQVELFRRLRSEPEESPESDRLRELIRLTIQGIAGGLRTTG